MRPLACNCIISRVRFDEVQQCAQKEDFRGGFQEFDEIFEGKNLFQFRHRIEFVEIRLDRFRCDNKNIIKLLFEIENVFIISKNFYIFLIKDILLEFKNN